MVDEQKIKKTTKKEAKYWKDKHVLELPGHQLLHQGSKRTAVELAGIDPDNYDKIYKENTGLDYKVLKPEKKKDDSLRYQFLKHLRLREFSQASELLVKEILNRMCVYTLKVDDKREVWIYKDGIYVPQGKSEIQDLLRVLLGEIYSNYHAKMVMDKIEVDTFIEPDDFFKINYKDEVPVMNGILNIFTGELNPFDPKKVFFNKLPVKFDPSTQCPEIEKFLSEVLADKEDIKVFYELGGFSLMKEYIFEKAFMFVGNGRNGKGKSLELLKRVIGIENCAALPLNALHSDNFSISELFGKMVNLAGDIDNKDLRDTSMFKSLTGRDLVAGKRKFLRDIIFENYAKFIFSCNDLPMVYDLSKGFWDRWVLLEFPHTFVTQTELNKNKDNKDLKLRDENIIDKITTEKELSGLLNKFLLGLNRLISNKEFSSTKGSEEIKTLWIRKSNSFIAFCMDKIEEDYDNSIKKSELRRVYSKYCKEHKIRGKSDIVIKATLQELFGADEERITGTNEFGVSIIDRCWVGIKWK